METDARDQIRRTRGGDDEGNDWPEAAGDAEGATANTETVTPANEDTGAGGAARGVHGAGLAAVRQQSDGPMLAVSSPQQP